MDQYSTKPLLVQKVLGCLIGGAVGDAIAPPEGKNPEEILRATAGSPTLSNRGTVPPRWARATGATDDSHMVQISSRIYLDVNDHLDVYRFAEIVPPIADHRAMCRNGAVTCSCSTASFTPKSGSTSCGSLTSTRASAAWATWSTAARQYGAAPVGIVNACDPQAAYREAIEIFSAAPAQLRPRGRGVMAACVAEAFRPGASVDSIVDVALSLAQEDTRCYRRRRRRLRSHPE